MLPRRKPVPGGPPLIFALLSIGARLLALALLPMALKGDEAAPEAPS